MNLMIPTIHTNGTSKEELVKQVQDSLTQLNVAIASLIDAAPHGRDYYPQGPDAYKQAALQHEDRVSRIKSVYAELESLLESIVDTPDWRTR